MESTKKALLNYLVLTNQCTTRIQLFDAVQSKFIRNRNRILNNIINMRKQQMLLATSISFRSQRILWQLDRSKTFWEIDCQVNSDEYFKLNFRMNRASFNLLCSHLKAWKKEDTSYRQAITLEKRVAIALYALGSSAEYRSIANLFGVGKSTVCIIVKEFCMRVWIDLQPSYLNHLPLSSQNVEECVQGFEKLGFPQCLGAIDGCHIEVHPHTEDAVDYFNFKGWYSVILFALVDYRYRFLYINVGSPGRCNDSTIFENSQLRKYLEHCPLLNEYSKQLNGIDIPVLIIGDSAFRLSKNVMKPYPFHYEKDERTRNFNYYLSKARRVVENAFGHLKIRFRRIGKGIDNDVDNANAIIKACCVLHNFLNEHNDNINNSWVMEQALGAEREQPEHEVLIGSEGISAETIRHAIAASMCTIYDE